MDLSHPLASVTTPLTAHVLEVLAGTRKSLTGRDVHRLTTSGSRSGVWQVLERLTEQGIVRADPRSAATFYEANREHLAWPAIEQLINLRAELRERLKHRLDSWAIQALHASMFGSAARGDATKSSDIDLLIVQTIDDQFGDEEERWQGQLADLRDYVLAITGNHAQTMAIGPRRLFEYAAVRDPILAAWRRDGILLAGTPLAQILSRGAT